MRIAFLSRISRAFNGDTVLTEPLGGTQSALVYLARELQALGHEVHVFCNCKEKAGIFEGVTYHNVPELARFARQNPLDFFISCADESALKLGIPSKHALWWSHNDYCFLWDEMPDLRAKTAEILATKTDKLLAVSQWQAEKLAELFHLPISHFFITGNAIHAPYFESEPTPATPPRLLYTSVPDRGLDLLLAFFPEIQAQVPEAELHIYSSFTVWGKSQEWNDTQAGPLYEKARALPGVFLHDPLPHAALAQTLLQGSLMLYPNHAAEPLSSSGFWAETSCIAAIEAQAAGLPVISSARGALPETIVDGQTGILIPGDPLSEEYRSAFVAETIALLKDTARRQSMGQAARKRILSEYTWQKRAQEWEEFLAAFESSRMTESPLTSTFEPPEISVIIPTYNRARNLKNCLESLTWQDFTAFEVIVCDDGSSDNTREVVASFKERLNLGYCWQEDLGFRAAEVRNLGLQRARSKLIVFLDSDLVVPSTFLTAHWQAHQQYPKVAVNSYVMRMLEPKDDDLGLPPAEFIAKHRANLKPDNRDRYELFERVGPVEETYFLDSNALSMWRKDLEQVGNFDANFVGWGHEDTELGYRIAQYGMKMVFIKAGTEAYHQHHAFSAAKDEERAVNWKLLTQKHGINNWYHPLWELPIEGAVQVLVKGDLPTQPLFLPPWLNASWDLKTGHTVPLAGLHYMLKVEEGILTAIEPFGDFNA
jgi:glycosyltransferase involved in cell wall biosynthesis